MRGRGRDEECRARVNAAAGRELTDDEQIELFERIRASTNRRLNAGETPDAAARRAGMDQAALARREALVAQRQRHINILAETGLEARKVVGDEANSLQAATAGSARGGPNFGFSVQALGKATHESLVRNLQADLVRADLMPVLSRRDTLFEQEFTNELWYLEDPNVTRPRATDPQARQAAEIFHRHQELLRLLLNEAGAFIGKLDHYVTRQSHDMWKIRAETYEAWRDYILPRLDADRTFAHLADPEKQEGFLKNVWNALNSGVHQHSNGIDWLGGFTGPGNLAKRLSEERVLHFKDGDSFYEYNQRFGHGSIIGSILDSFERGSMNYAAMKVFGTNPKAMVNKKRAQWAEEAAARGDARSVKISDTLRDESFDGIIKYMTGEANTPKGQNLAWWGQTVRNFKNITSLGFSVIRSLPDLDSQARMLRANGMPYFQAMSRQLAEMLPTNSVERRHALLQMYGGTKGMLADVGARFRAEDSRSGGLATASNFEFKLNGQNWWNRTLRNGSGSGLGMLWADHLKHPFDDLSWDAHSILKRYGLDDEASWRALREVKTEDVDGDNFLFPGEIMNLPDSAVAHLGPSPNRARENLRDRMSTLFSDQMGEALSDPTWRQRSFLSAGQRPGTYTGELARTMFQFKTFVVTFLERSAGREIFRGQGFDIAGYHVPNVNFPGVVQLMIGTTFFGGMGIMLVDLLSGKDPRDRFNKPGLFFLEAVAAGGGLGIFGDILFGKNEYGRGLAQTLAGPAITSLDEIRTIVSNFVHGDWDKIPGELGKLGQKNVPYANLWFASLALKHLFFYGLQEALNPGYLRRMEQKARRDEVTHWLRPTEAVQF